MSLAVRRGLLVLVGVLLLQSAWMLAVPPFRGSDEFDHAFRAAGVATGQWHLSQGAHDGRGQLVWVPRELAAAASAQCASLSYPGPDNCHPVEVRGDRALIATAAGPYDPLYYWVMGTAARPFSGSHALYAMRITTALICALLLGLGAGLLTLAGSGRWVTLGVVAAIVPEVIYSSVIAAPDGPEMSLGLVLWASLLALVRQHDVRRERLLLSTAIGSAVLLAFIRQLGPLWILAILASVVVFLGRARVMDVVRRHRALAVSGVGLVFLATCWWALWQLIASHVTRPVGAVPQTRETRSWILAFNLPAWILQMIGAFPYRDQPAPLWVYPFVLMVILLFLVGAYRSSRGTRDLRTVRLLTAATLVIPVALSIVFMPSYGAIWQGRYELVYVIGVLPLCGLLLDRRGFAPVEGARLTVTALLFLAMAQVVCVVNVMHAELARPESTEHSGWVHPPLAVVALLALLGSGVLSRMVWQATSDD
jgi:hypothetical protein